MTVRTRTATVLSHARPAQTAEALHALIEAAEREGVLLRFDAEETRKYGLTPRDGLVLDAALSDDVELCVSLGGDGTILRALRRYAGTSVPVFAVNFGEVGFLATIDPDDGDLDEAFERALAGDFEVLTLPALALETPEGPQAAIRRPGRCAATGSCSPPRRARRATTWPTAARCWRGAWRASSSRSSRRTR